MVCLFVLEGHAPSRTLKLLLQIWLHAPSGTIRHRHNILTCHVYAIRLLWQICTRQLWIFQLRKLQCIHSNRPSYLYIDQPINESINFFVVGCEGGSCSPNIPFQLGRVDCPNRKSPPNRKDFFFPGPHNHNAPKLGAEFNLTMEEHTAILGQ